MVAKTLFISFMLHICGLLKGMQEIGVIWIAKTALDAREDGKIKSK